MGAIEVRRPPHRGWSVVAGICLMVAGVLFIVAPAFAALLATAWFGATLIALGVVLSIGALVYRGTGWGWSLTRAVLAVVAGLLLLAQPVAGLVSFTLVLGVYLAGAGAARIGLAASWYPFTGWGTVLASGVLGIVLAVLVFAGWPRDSLALVGTLLGLEAFLDGFALLAAAPSRARDLIDG